MFPTYEQEVDLYELQQKHIASIGPRVVYVLGRFDVDGHNARATAWNEKAGAAWEAFIREVAERAESNSFYRGLLSETCVMAGLCDDSTVEQLIAAVDIDHKAAWVEDRLSEAE